jgi:hypothetical protein
MSPGVGVGAGLGGGVAESEGAEVEDGVADGAGRAVAMGAHAPTRTSARTRFLTDLPYRADLVPGNAGIEPRGPPYAVLLLKTEVAYAT